MGLGQRELLVRVAPVLLPLLPSPPPPSSRALFCLLGWEAGGNRPHDRMVALGECWGEVLLPALPEMLGPGLPQSLTRHGRQPSGEEAQAGLFLRSECP